MEVRDCILELIAHSPRSLFITGKAGTGKTTLLKEIVERTYKNCIVAAPTGIAALNANGVTLHSLFQIPTGMFVPEEIGHTAAGLFTPALYWRQVRMQESKRKLLRRLELLIIDEVSMLRADLLDCIDMILRGVRRKDEPMGGVQVVFIGDLLQLPPVVRQEEIEILSRYYEGMFFFQSRLVRQYPPLYLELEHVYRQSDNSFVSVLNNLRHNRLTAEDFTLLNKHVRTDFDSLKHDDYVMLTTHNHKVDAINKRALDKINAPSKRFTAEITGEFSELTYPAECTLELKVGARVMFLRNDTETPRRYYNGKVGTVVSLDERGIKVKPQGGGRIIDVEPYEWKNLKYVLSPESQTPSTKTVGTFKQYPLRAAWGITVHKSQGLTFEHAALDLEGIFAAGQAYVALSRLTSLDGLVLLSPISLQWFGIPKEVTDYAHQRLTTEQARQLLEAERRSYWCSLSAEAMDWREWSTAWRVHSLSYKAESNQSLKSHYGDWASETTITVERLTNVALTFRKQLYALWSDHSVSTEHIRERVARAYEYFEPELTALGHSTAEVMTEVSHQKKAKQYLRELQSLNALLYGVMQRLMRVDALLEALVKGDSITRESLGVSLRLHQWQAQFAPQAAQDKSVGSAKKKPYTTQRSKGTAAPGEKAERIRTQDQTLELWRKGLSPEEIAQQRGLGLTTIEGHLAYQITQRRIEPERLFSLERAQAPIAAFRTRGRVTALKEIYEQFDGAYSYPELRYFLAYYETYLMG